jgi:hypothetical protein
MNLSQSHCNKLVEETAAGLDQKILQALFVSTQKNQMELCFKYSIQYEYIFVYDRTVLNINHRNSVMDMLTTNAKAKFLKEIFAPGITFQFLIRYVKEICPWFPISVVRIGLFYAARYS